jgi:hypothetical protein
MEAVRRRPDLPVIAIMRFETEEDRFRQLRAKAERLTRKLEEQSQNSGRVPVWVQKLINKTADDYSVPVPPIGWRRSKIHKWSSGRTFHHRIVVTAGKDRQDQKLALLHELAHWIVQQDDARKDEVHSPEFWRVAFDLYAEHKMIKYATYREGLNWARAKTEGKRRKARS